MRWSAAAADRAGAAADRAATGKTRHPDRDLRAQVALSTSSGANPTDCLKRLDASQSCPPQATSRVGQATTRVSGCGSRSDRYNPALRPAELVPHRGEQHDLADRS